MGKQHQPDEQSVSSDLRNRAARGRSKIIRQNWCNSEEAYTQQCVDVG